MLSTISINSVYLGEVCPHAVVVRHPSQGALQCHPRVADQPTRDDRVQHLAHVGRQPVAQQVAKDRGSEARGKGCGAADQWRGQEAASQDGACVIL